ncbi:histamine N-methyltransferase A-like [Patiria miniata]|uniref:Histamine N-methyltransferase n=1 Tax=Patiria miniata TaxID=46514 RepID=A0A914AX84_PATMI|nr:histamine N-methyltransferase A-like [Patiria miniata]XP_038068306.1 histamine N-methyltransferase A-like [Patiria miniata]XP_038068307.1 histamine N-methyltransferase A-like [Patiria miniata]XP_038068308.1 histamine N-methyltransferase A-like [Patiria miniata]XP_038068309.1 histamine N-methyltransferase A-like [Patiria miniata]XP_038068310.1 histamine N-methyltransferase A-like [Patiria miniata]XP_038068311.1 histamine N-methyltransferase A-like [Patiria miniata]XP_038068312.1 histamine 
MEFKLRSLFHDPEYYTKAFHCYAALSAKFSVLANWGETVFGEAVVDKIKVTLGENEELRVLGMGSGSGEMDMKMLTKLLRRFPLINNRVVEPAMDQLVKYKALAQSKAHDLHGVICDWRQQTIDQYEKAGDSRQFHFISSIHSIYYADDVYRSLMYLYDRLEPGGILLVVTVSDDSGYWRLWNHFPSFQDSLMTFTNSSHIRGSLERRGIPCTQYHQRSRVEITQCFDEASEEGALVVDFLTHVIKLKETAPAQLYKEVIEYLGSDHCSEKSAGDVLFNNDWDAVVVCKPVD